MEIKIIAEGRQQTAVVEIQPLHKQLKVCVNYTVSYKCWKLFISLHPKCLLLFSQLPRKLT